MDKHMTLQPRLEQHQLKIIIGSRSRILVSFNSDSCEF
jgi:hypothetical protein